MLLRSPNINVLDAVSRFLADPEAEIDTKTPRAVVDGLLETYSRQEPELQNDWQISITYMLHISSDTHVSLDTIVGPVLENLESFVYAHPQLFD